MQIDMVQSDLLESVTLLFSKIVQKCSLMDHQLKSQVKTVDYSDGGITVNCHGRGIKHTVGHDTGQIRGNMTVL